MPRPNDASHAVAADPAIDDIVLLDGATNGTRQLSLAAWLAKRVNALAPRGGIAFDGTANSRLYSTLTNQLIGNDPFSVSMSLVLPNATGSINVLWGLGSNVSAPGNSAYGIYCEYNSASGRFLVRIYGASTSDYLTWAWAYASTHKPVAVVFLRSAAGTPTIYIDGESLGAGYSASASGTASFAGSITSTYFGIGYNYSTNVIESTFYGATLYNLALSGADVVEIYQLGGAVPERYKFGSQSAINTTTWATLSATVTTNTATAISFSQAGGAAYFRSTAVASPGGKIFRIRGNTTSLTAVDNAITLTRQAWGGYDGVVISGAGAITATPGAFGAKLVGTGAWEVIFQRVFATSPQDAAIGVKLSGSPDGAVAIDTISFVQLGAIAHLPLDDGGLSLQLRDASTNALDALRTATGVSDLIPLARGTLRASAVNVGTAAYLLQSGDVLVSGVDVTCIQITNGGASSAVNVKVQLSDGSNHTDLMAAATIAAGATALVFPSAAGLDTRRRLRVVADSGADSLTFAFTLSRRL